MSGKKIVVIALLAVASMILGCLCLGMYVSALEDIGKLPTVEYSQKSVSVSTESPQQTPYATEPTAPTETPLPTEIPTAAPTKDPSVIFPGTYMVGSDILPGIYTGNAGNDIFNSCYWATVKDLSGDLFSINANDNAIGKFYVEVLNTDYAFETMCEVKFLQTLHENMGEFPNVIEPGMYLVGIDIKAGTYKGQVGIDFEESCYWARLNNVAGSLSSIIANDNATGQFYVEISESDFAFKTACQLERVGE